MQPLRRRVHISAPTEIATNGNPPQQIYDFPMRDLSEDF